jgi:glutamate formiminotransferase
MTPVLEAVPNFSEGRDPALVRHLVETLSAVDDVEILDWSADADHHRAVVTLVGPPAAVEEAAVRGAQVAVERIDLRSHQGAHPRVGALDVLPFVPLRGLSMDAAAASARRVGRRLAGMGIPVYYYGEASDPPGRRLADLRRGGFEALAEGFPPDRAADEPDGASRPHPTAGVTCVGARPLLLAWNVFVSGLEPEEVRALARSLRETAGGFPGLRALGLHLPGRDRLQVSMNLEDLGRTAPLEVYRAIEAGVAGRGGRVEETEVIGMIPDALVLPAAGDRLHLPGLEPARLLSHRVSRHVINRTVDGAESLRDALAAHGDAVPDQVRDAAFRLLGALLGNDDGGR